MSSFGGFNSDGQQQGTMSEINMIPLIDVMLVLLIIFIITAPLMTHAIKIDVPQVSSQPAEQEPDSVDLAIRATGEMFWNSEPLEMSELRQKMAELVELQQDKPVNLRIRAESDTYYEDVAQVMAAARLAGVKRLGFITSPEPTAAATTDTSDSAEAAAAPTTTAEPAQQPSAATATSDVVAPTNQAAASPN